MGSEAQALCASHPPERDGYPVHAGVAFGALDRKGRKTLVRYMLQPAIAIERVSTLRDGLIAYRTKYRTTCCSRFQSIPIGRHRR